MNANDHDDVVHDDARGCTIAADGGPEAMREDARQCTIGAGDVRAREAAELTERQRTAMGLLLLGTSLGAVARTLGIDPSTLYRWRHDETFSAELDLRRRELWDGAAERLRALVHPAIDVLEEEVHDEYDRSRIRAAGMILRLADLRKCVPPAKG